MRRVSKRVAVDPVTGRTVGRQRRRDRALWEIEGKNVTQLTGMENRWLEADPVGLLRGSYLTIRPKEGDLMKFTPNPVQERILQVVQESRKAKRPVRLVILKARQVGVTTLCEALLYAFVMKRWGTSGLVMADDEDGAAGIFRMTELFGERMMKEYPHVTVGARRSDERRMELTNGSSLRIETANNRTAGRKFTVQYAHLSEAAFYRDLPGLLQAMKPSIPDDPETMLILESTANGVNDFCRFYREKKRLASEGRTEWVPLFFGWADDAGYRKTFSSDSERQRFLESMDAREKELTEFHRLSPEQLHWRRRTLEDSFMGDLEKFETEYPLTDEECFKSSSRRVFAERLVEPQKRHRDVPFHTGEVAIAAGRPVFLPDAQGFLRVVKGPMPDWTYVIGADPCESAVSHDEACAQVLARQTWEVVAHLHGHMAPEDFAVRLDALGRFYNLAALVVERNGPGLVTVTRLSERGYPALCRTQKSVVTDSGQWVETEEYGFNTNSRTKPLLIETLSTALRDLLCIVHDPRTIEQLENYVVKSVNPDGYAVLGSDTGSRDDCVMALALALYRAKQTPLIPASSRRSWGGPRPSGVTGYGG